MAGPLQGDTQLANTFAVLGTSANPILGDVRNDLLRQILVAVCNRSSGGGGSSTFAALTDSPYDNAALATALNSKVDKAGDTMTGALAITPTGTLNTAGLTLSQTWNNAGTTCRGLELAVTDTNSAAGSTLLRLLGGVGGVTPLLTVGKTGSLAVSGLVPITDDAVDVGAEFPGNRFRVGNFTNAVKALFFQLSSGSGAYLFPVGFNGKSAVRFTTPDGNDFSPLVLGPATSAFPAIDNSGTTLLVRLGDNSGYAPIDAASYKVGGVAGVSGTITGASTVTVVNGIITVIA